MLTKLLPDQISKFWPIIKYAVEESLPPLVGEAPDKMNRILSAMLSGKLDVWISHRQMENNVTKVEGIVVTQILYDDASNTYSMLIYTIYAYIETRPETWIDGLDTIAKYALSKGCTRYIAYSNVPYVIEKAKQSGADTSYTFISFPLTSWFNR